MWANNGGNIMSNEWTIVNYVRYICRLLNGEHEIERTRIYRSKKNCSISIFAAIVRKWKIDFEMV